MVFWYELKRMPGDMYGGHFSFHNPLSTHDCADFVGGVTDSADREILTNQTIKVYKII